MAFSIDESWVYGGQLIVSAPFITPQALGIGPAKIDHSVYLQGPVQHGRAGDFGESVATTMIGRSDTVTTPRAIHTKGNVRIEGDGDTTSAINVTGGASHAGYFKGGSPDAVNIEGDLYVTAATECGNKGPGYHSSRQEQGCGKAAVTSGINSQDFKVEALSLDVFLDGISMLIYTHS